MAKMKILVYPNPVLAKKCEPVTEFNSELAQTVSDMLETMYDAEGIGLAAPQVGISKRFVVIDISKDRNEPIILINPKITFRDGVINESEGCLSIPDYHEVVKRNSKIKVTAQDIHGEHIELECEDLLARCVQHELDHLDGVLFVDRGSALKKQLFKRWMKKHVFVEKEEANEQENID